MYKIGIMGKANTGKNTLAKIIVNNLRLEARKGRRYLPVKYIAFADPIKEMAMIMYPEIPKKFLYGSSTFRNEIIPGAFKEGVPLTVRQLLIDIGTAAREYDPDVWLKNFSYTYEKFKCYNDYVFIVTDVRFRNEINLLRSENFQMIRVYRNTIVPSTHINHISEIGQNDIGDDEFNYIVNNDKSLKQLKHDIMYNVIPRLRNIK